jgi:kynurenine formamidase
MRLVTTRGALKNAVTAIKDRCLGRGVLADVASWAGVDALAPGHQIRAADLEACLDAQGVALQPGDFLLVRTGQIGHARRHGWGQYAGGHAPGLTLDTAMWLREASVAAVASDTWGAEVRPNEFTGVIQPWHRLVISNVGLTVGEMFNLEELAEACADDRRFTFFLTAPALPLVGGTGSPVNPLAIR